nr:ABC-three component system middle component 6 [Leifsonia soli]
MLTVGAQISMILTEPMTVSQAWTALKAWRARHENDAVLPFSWFVLALDVLFALGAIHLEDGILYRKQVG